MEIDIQLLKEEHDALGLNFTATSILHLARIEAIETALLSIAEEKHGTDKADELIALIEETIKKSLNDQIQNLKHPDLKANVLDSLEFYLSD